MVDITLFELHLDGSEFTANAPNSGVFDGDEVPAEDDAGGGAPLGLVAGLALVVLVVVAAVAARKRGDDGE